MIAILLNLAALRTRGPQITSTEKGLTVIACNDVGNIFSYHKIGSDNWVQSVKINDVDNVAKESLMAISGNEKSAFAVWLDTRGNGHNKIYGVRSIDGGKTWAKNIMAYTSPGTTVCQCCKPSVAVKGNDVYVVFRKLAKRQ